MGTMWIVWLVLAAVFLVVELVTVAMISLWFVGGCLAGMIASLAGADLYLQIIIMFGTSLVFLLLFFSLRKKLGIMPGVHLKTNADRLLGKSAEVIMPIDPVQNKGQVQVNGQIWSAKTGGDRVIPVGTLVKVEALEGVKLLVTEI